MITLGSKALAADEGLLGVSGSHTPGWHRYPRGRRKSLRTALLHDPGWEAAAAEVARTGRPRGPRRSRAPKLLWPRLLRTQLEVGVVHGKEWSTGGIFQSRRGGRRPAGEGAALSHQRPLEASLARADGGEPRGLAMGAYCYGANNKVLCAKLAKGTVERQPERKLGKCPGAGRGREGLPGRQGAGVGVRVPQSPLPQGGRAPLGSPSLYVCSQGGPVALRA